MAIKISNETDYTTWRKGTIVSRNPKTGYTTRIDVCPKCGRKGQVHPEWTDERGKRFPASVTHKGQVETVAGFSMFHVTDYCHLPLKAES